ncbi:MAG: IS66 family insertion sequence element accessory protein TnpB [Nitrosomonas sp.]|nr:IS66 family insertion sequence element accessory protein TnpB [Nitrosomonas sp.]
MRLQEQQLSHIKAWQSSELSQAAYCCEHGLNSKTFGNWLRIYRQAQQRNQPASVVPVMITPAVPASDYLKLRCSGGHTLELPANVCPQWLGELLKCLG